MVTAALARPLTVPGASSRQRSSWRIPRPASPAAPAAAATPRRTKAAAVPSTPSPPSTTLTTPATTLSAAEAAARAAFLAGRSADAADADAVATLLRAGAARDADGDAVLGALAHALTAGRALPGTAPATPAALHGGGRGEAAAPPGLLPLPWRLVYSSPAPLPAWRYIPVPEFFAIPPPGAGAGRVCLSSDVGPLHFAFSGLGTWQEEGEEGARGGASDAVLAFSFGRADVSWGRDAAGPFFSRPFGRGGGGGAGGAPRPPKTYTFFAYVPGGEVEVVGARSSGGALSLLARRVRR